MILVSKYHKVNYLNLYNLNSEIKKDLNSNIPYMSFITIKRLF